MSSATETQSLSDRLQNLMHINQTIAGCLEESNVLRCSLELEKEIVDAQTGSILLLDDSGEYLNFAVALGEAGDVLEDYRVRVGEGVAGYAAEYKEPVLIEDTSRDQRFDDYFDRQTGFDTETMLCAPIQVGDRLLGVAQVINKVDGTHFTEDDLILFSAFAGQIGVSLENARLHEEILDRERIQQELKTARKVQESYLPDEFPQLMNIEFGAQLRSAEQVSGDFYDCFDLPDERIAYVIGDVSGKGMPAAMYMCRVLTELRTGLSQGGSPHEIMNRVNTRLCETSTEGMFVTLQLFIINSQTQTVEVANAGHLPFFLNTNGTVELIGSDENPPLGIEADHHYASYEFALTDDSIVFAVTDGLIEVRNDENEMFELLQMKEILQETRLPPELLVKKIFLTVNQFHGSNGQRDDMTAIAFGRPLIENEFSFEISSHPEYLELVRNVAGELLSRAGVSEKRTGNIQVGISEAIENIIEHTYHNQPHGRIKIKMGLDENTFFCSLRDFGKSVNETEIKGRDLDEVEPGGLGVHFMDQIFDQCEYTDVDTGNCLVLENSL